MCITRAIAVANGQMFKAEPLSNRMDGTLWPKQPTVIYRGHVWSEPSSGKSSFENTIHVALLAVII